MSDKIYYSDREDYDRFAFDVLSRNVLGLINLKRENKLTEEQQAKLASYNFTSEEMYILEAYDKHYRSYLHCSFLDRHPNIRQNDYFVKTELLHCKEVLARLEVRREMQDILNRFRKPNEDIQLTFANEYFQRINNETYFQRTQTENQNKSLINTIIAVGVFLIILVFAVYLSRSYY